MSTEKGLPAGDSGILSSVVMLWRLLTPKERVRGILVTGLMLLFACVDAAGVASIMPFLAVLGDPTLVASNPVLSRVYRTGEFESIQSFQMFLGAAAFCVVIASAALRVITTYVSNRYIQMRRYSLGERLMEGYLDQPYEFFLHRNSADLSKTILSEVDEVVYHVLKPTIDLLSYGTVAIVITALLIAVDPLLALIITVVVGGVYGMIYIGVRRLLRKIGAERITANTSRFVAASDVFGGIKDLKVLGREEAYLRRFRLAAARFARYHHMQLTLSATPKYLIEAVGFGGIVALALGLMATRDDLGQVLPLLGLYAFGGYKLLPAAQHIFAGISGLRFGGPAIAALLIDLPSATRRAVPPPENGSRFELTREIAFQHVSHRYAGASSYALEDFTVSISRRTTLGIVGQTGAGKTTAVDLFLGLLIPTHGRILLDGRPLHEVGERTWQRSVGYVPQSIYLADASIAENIAFGVEPANIDQAALERAARVASIHDFITMNLPSGYATEVGERGVRLSGGQRQRLGIARALYHDPEVLVFDEATSALDTATESAIIDAVELLSGQKTIVIIAHRMSTVARCDRIVVLECGRVVGIGSFDELIQSNASFQRIAVA